MDEAQAGFMGLALEQARLAASAGEVPVGAVVVRHGKLIAVGRNSPRGAQDPTAHAEIVALRSAAAVIGNYRLDECELYVTLEPCAMCSGAMLHARLKRVVFGAPDPKTGACGSVVNLFAEGRLNHQTQVVGGIMAEQSAVLLQSFFATRRVHNRLQVQLAHPLREDAVRTADTVFQGLPGYPWEPHYISDLASLNGLRLHYLDEGGSGNEQLTYLCLHGYPAWSYVYRRMIPILLQAGHRVIAPDLIGFGKSDKPKRSQFHRFSWHRQVLLELIERLDLSNLVLVVQDWGGLLGLTLPLEARARYRGLLVMNTLLATGERALPEGLTACRDWYNKNPEFDVGQVMLQGNPHLTSSECAAYNAPFEGRGWRAALRAFPNLVPTHADGDGATPSRLAQAFWASDWQGQSLMAVGQQDPVMGTTVMADLHRQIRGCAPPLLLPDAGHVVQEHGEQVAREAALFFKLK